jgi:hypothetical protein
VFEGVVCRNAFVGLCSNNKSMHACVLGACICVHTRFVVIDAFEDVCSLRSSDFANTINRPIWSNFQRCGASWFFGLAYAVFELALWHLADPSEVAFANHWSTKLFWDRIRACTVGLQKKKESRYDELCGRGVHHAQSCMEAVLWQRVSLRFGGKFLQATGEGFASSRILWLSLGLPESGCDSIFSATSKTCTITHFDFIWWLF